MENSGTNIQNKNYIARAFLMFIVSTFFKITSLGWRTIAYLLFGGFVHIVLYIISVIISSKKCKKNSEFINITRILIWSYFCFCFFFTDIGDHGESGNLWIILLHLDSFDAFTQFCLMISLCSLAVNVIYIIYAIGKSISDRVNSKK